MLDKSDSGLWSYCGWFPRIGKDGTRTASEEVTNLLASEPSIGLTAADYAFSSLCNEDKFRSKTKPAKLAEGAPKNALKRAGAGRNSGGGLGVGGNGAGGDGAGGSRGGTMRGREREFKWRDNNDRDHRHACDPKRRF